MSLDLDRLEALGKATLAGPLDRSTLAERNHANVQLGRELRNASTELLRLARIGIKAEEIAKAYLIGASGETLPFQEGIAHAAMASLAAATGVEFPAWGKREP